MVEIGHISLLEDCHLNLDTSIEGLLYYFTGENLLHLGANECWAFAWLNMLELNDGPQLAIDIERHAILQIIRCCHQGTHSLVRHVMCPAGSSPTCLL